MGKKDVLLGAVLILAIAGFIWAINERSKRQLAELKLNKINENYLKLLSDFLETRTDIPDSLKTQLIDLRKEYSGIDDAIAIRLQDVVDLIQMEKEKIALEKLALIVENILKDKYISEGKARDRKSCPSFHGLIRKAKEFNWIKLHHFNFSMFLKEKRNEEVHELIPDISDNEIIIAFFSGIEIIYQLRGIKRAA